MGGTGSFYLPPATRTLAAGPCRVAVPARRPGPCEGAVPEPLRNPRYCVPGVSSSEDNEPMSRIVLGVSGGVAAYKAALLLRALTEAGHDVRVVPTPGALHFVGAATFEALSGNPV